MLKLKNIMNWLMHIIFLVLYLFISRLYAPLLINISRLCGPKTLLTKMVFILLNIIMSPLLFIYHLSAAWEL